MYWKFFGQTHILGPNSVNRCLPSPETSILALKRARYFINRQAEKNLQNRNWYFFWILWGVTVFYRIGSTCAISFPSWVGRSIFLDFSKKYFLAWGWPRFFIFCLYRWYKLFVEVWACSDQPPPGNGPIVGFLPFVWKKERDLGNMRKHILYFIKCCICKKKNWLCSVLQRTFVVKNGFVFAVFLDPSLRGDRRQCRLIKMSRKVCCYSCWDDRSLMI